jgi:hypothetical protein
MMNSRQGRPPHIEVEYPTEQLDRVLREYYRYSLSDFALSLAIVFRCNPPFRLYNIWRLKRGSFEILEDYREKTDRLKRTLDRIYQRLSSHLEDVGYWRSINDGVENQYFPSLFPAEHPQAGQNGEIPEEEKMHITKRIYGLDKLEETINSEVLHYEALLRLYSSGHPGRPALVKTIISAFWSYALKFRGRLNADAIPELLNWFLARLANTSYGRDLDRSIRDGYPTSEDMSRFRQHFGRGLLEDFELIFHCSSPEIPNVQSPWDLGIRFDRDEPRFFRIQPSEETAPLPIEFP